jgi:hypothetical protein
MGRPSAESFTRLLVMTMALSSSGIVAWPVVSRTAALQLPTVPVRAGEVGRSLSQQDIAALQQTLLRAQCPGCLLANVARRPMRNLLKRIWHRLWRPHRYGRVR